VLAEPWPWSEVEEDDLLLAKGGALEEEGGDGDGPFTGAGGDIG